MEVESSDGEEQDIFAGIHAPQAETESEYEISGGEDDLDQDDNGERARLEQPLAKSQLLKSPSAFKLPLRNPDRISLKRKDSPTKSVITATKKLRTANWSLHRKYRDLLNVDITDVITRNAPDDNRPLQDSQIGSTTWTGEEKEIFFAAISKFGRDSIKDIAWQVRTKSEPEVREYLYLLHTEFVHQRSRARVLELPDFPAAVEISEECCEQMKEVADAFIAKQEQHEIKAERQKWGESWLLTPETSHWLNQRRAQSGGMKAINDVIPAANIFNLDKWLELSKLIFMNPATPYEEDNWNYLVEGGDGPAIRATAFEDLHSLAVSITKKLVSTIIFCTLSRERATNARKIKHADVTPTDVEAAVKILKLPHNSEDYWRNCARRCHLNVVDDETDIESVRELTYEEVEAELISAPPNRRSRSLSRSVTHQVQQPEIPNQADLPIVESNESDLADKLPLNYDSSVPSSPTSIFFSDIETSRSRFKSVRDREAQAIAIEEYTEAVDQQAGLNEELRLWECLKKDLPQSVVGRVEKLRGEGELVRPKRVRTEYDDRLEWRELVTYRTDWESMEKPVLEASFVRNRRVKVVRTKTGEESGKQGLCHEFVDDDLATEDDGDGQEDELTSDECESEHETEEGGEHLRSREQQSDEESLDEIGEGDDPKFELHHRTRADQEIDFAFNFETENIEPICEEDSDVDEEESDGSQDAKAKNGNVHDNNEDVGRGGDLEYGETHGIEPGEPLQGRQYLSSDYSE